MIGGDGMDVDYCKLKFRLSHQSEGANLTGPAVSSPSGMTAQAGKPSELYGKNLSLFIIGAFVTWLITFTTTRP